jgi:hypothetical protein
VIRSGGSGRETPVVPDTRVSSDRDLGDGDDCDVDNRIAIPSDDKAVDDVVQKVTTASSRSNDHRMVTAHQLMVTGGGVTTSGSRRRGFTD